MATRRERVVLELQDDFTTGMARAAAATAVLDKELNSLSNDSVKSQRTTRNLNRELEGTGKTARKVDADLNQFTGRVRVLAEVAGVIAPAFAPLGAVAVPAVTGLASALGFTAVGAGVAVLAFQGLGDTMKAVNKASIEPTTKNLEAARLALGRLSPEAAGFAEKLASLKPGLENLRNLAAAGLFPGLSRGLDGLEGALPRVQAIISAISTELGDIGGDAGESLGSERWAPFLDFVATEGPAALAQLAEAVGNTAHAFAGLWMATTPLNDGFSSWLVDATADLDRWSNSLGETEGFQEFVKYIQETGPQVADTLGALANAALQIVEAIAPLGGPSLRILEAIADVLATIADSPIGTPLLTLIGAMSALNLATRGFQGIQKATFAGPGVTAIRNYADTLGTITTAQQRATLSTKQLAAAENKRRATLASGAAGFVAFGAVATGVADKLNLTNTASLAMAGSLAGPWGTAIGAGVGALMDFTDHSDEAAESATRFQNSLEIFLASAGPDAADQIAALAGEIDKLNSVTLEGTSGMARDLIVDQLTTAQGELQHQVDLTAATNSTAAATTDRYADSITSLTDAMREQRDVANSAFSAETRYRQALKDAREQADKSNAGLRGDTDEVLANRDALSSLAQAWNSQSDAVKNSKDRFREARAAFIETAEAMGVPLEQAKRLAKRLLEIPEIKVINIDANTDPALVAIEAVRRRLMGLRDRNINVRVSTLHQASDPRPGGLDGDPDTPYWSGGYTGPGDSREPRGIVHAGEVVIPAGLVKRDWSMLSSRYGDLPGFDRGGVVPDSNSGSALAYPSFSRADAMRSEAAYTQRNGSKQQQSYAAAAGIGPVPFTITNWETGQGYFTSVVDTRVDNIAASAARRNA